MVVAKFGGSSLADASQVQKVLRIVSEDRDRKVVVVSAPGKRDKADQKVTDLLIHCATAQIAGQDPTPGLMALLERYRSLIAGLGLDKAVYEQIEADLSGRLASYGAVGAGGGGGLRNIEFLDLMKAAGEDNCAKLVAAYFTSQGLPAVYIDPRAAGFLLSDNFGDAHVLPETYRNLAAALGGIKETIVFPGFFGCTRSGKVITFSRGGSDVTGSVLAAALDAGLYENFTDVDHVFSVDPGLVSDPLPIPELTYREMRELSYAGFKVYHEDALVPVFNKGIPVRIKNTNNPAAPGTAILPSRVLSDDRPVTGISAADGFVSINISKLLMNIEIGFGRKVLEIVEDEKISFEHMPSGIDNISVILKESAAPPEVERRIVERLKNELDVGEVTVRHDLALVMLVGEGMLNTVGTTARASGALARAKINIEIINQGASEVSLMFGVDKKDASEAVRSLYHEFFEQRTQGA
ncbi:MAG: aspartate kinase [Clostridiales bacterium]|jgi:aspartate kinase|nr:aspartate kinase [Clostridiales bacterium]